MVPAYSPEGHCIQRATRHGPLPGWVGQGEYTPRADSTGIPCLDGTGAGTIPDDSYAVSITGFVLAPGSCGKTLLDTVAQDFLDRQTQQFRDFSVQNTEAVRTRFSRSAQTDFAPT